MTWLDAGGCSKCASCGMDMDLEPFCVRTEVLEKVTAKTGRTYPYGLYINPARQACQGEFWVEDPRRISS